MTPVACPECGMYNVITNTFKCKVCGRDHLCKEHYSKNERCCTDCAAKVQARRVADEKARREAEEKARLAVLPKTDDVKKLVQPGGTQGEHKNVQLWKNGPYWAEMNIGAEKPWESGYYFWWGDTVGYKYENGTWVASDGSVTDFPFEEKNAPTCGKTIDTLKRKGWITAHDVLAPEHDAAYVQWGTEWRMPTEQELGALCYKCDWIWTTMNGVNGYVVRGKGEYASANIFLPCVGRGLGTSLFGVRLGSYYWSSVPYSDDSSAWNLDFYSGNHDSSHDRRYYGQSVRPVQGFTKQRTK